MMAESSFGKVLYRGVEKCPICGANSLEVAELLYEVPSFGNVILYSYRCSNCGYRHVDLQYLEEKKWKTYKYDIKDERDVTETMVFRSKTCRIRSPDLGFSIDPGIAAEAFITTVEGLLYKVLDLAERMLVLSESEEEKAKIREFIENVKKALRGERPFTLILEDPYGNSLIRPPRGREDRLETQGLISSEQESE